MVEPKKKKNLSENIFLNCKKTSVSKSFVSEVLRHKKETLLNISEHQREDKRKARPRLAGLTGPDGGVSRAHGG